MKSSSNFEIILRDLGNSWTVDKDMINSLEQYVCKLYGFVETDINQVRYKVFHKKYMKEKQSNRSFAASTV